jgi:hypothetical protein
VQKPAGRCGTADGGSAGVGDRLVAWRGAIEGPGAEELGDAVADHRAAIFAGARQHVLADDARLEVGTADQGVELMLDEFGLAFLDDQHRALAGTEVADFVGRSADR